MNCARAPAEDLEKVEYAEQVYWELTELSFSIRSPENWKMGFVEAGFSDVSVESFNEFLDVKRGLGMINEMGG